MAIRSLLSCAIPLFPQFCARCSLLASEVRLSFSLGECLISFAFLSVFLFCPESRWRGFTCNALCHLKKEVRRAMLSFLFEILCICKIPILEKRWAPIFTFQKKKKTRGPWPTIM